MKTSRSIIFLLGLLAYHLLLFPIYAQAIPLLGVAPGAPGSAGVYFGVEEDYLGVFANDFRSGEDGFALPGSGNALSIWFGSNNGNLNKDATVYLLTNSAAGDTFSFGTQTFTEQIDLDRVAGYKGVPYYGVSLGSINTNSSWSKLDIAPFNTGLKEFWVLTDTIGYENFKSDEWMFAYETNPGDFSPKTTSSTGSPVPEPATMFLLTSGLVGLAVFSRKFKRSVEGKHC
jgi:hypothetical protein